MAVTRRYDLVVFDWDGTLADSTAIIVRALQRACLDLGCAEPDEVNARYVIGLGLVDALRHLAPALSPQHYPRLSARYREHYLAQEDAIPLYAGARELLHHLAAHGHALAVATGKSRAGLDRALAFHALRDVFAVTRCADEGRPKPHPEMLDHIIERLGADRRRVLMVGDTTHDLQMAAAAGVDFVALSHGAHTAQMLAGASGGVCASLAELAQVIGAPRSAPSTD
jgi:phosphoglycolate phosphatase